MAVARWFVGDNGDFGNLQHVVSILGNNTVARWFVGGSNKAGEVLHYVVHVSAFSGGARSLFFL
jgi:hypothetical protein